MLISPVDILLQVLKPLVPVQVFVEVPSHRPDTFVRLQSTEPKPINLALNTTVVFVQVYGTNLEKVIEISALIERCLFNQAEMQHTDFMGWKQLESPYEHADPDIPTIYRWQQSGEVITTRDLSRGFF